MSGNDGGLHRSTQHFILNAKGGVYADESKKTLGIHVGREDRAVGSLAARGVIECDWSRILSSSSVPRLLMYSEPLSEGPLSIGGASGPLGQKSVLSAC